MMSVNEVVAVLEDLGLDHYHDPERRGKISYIYLNSNFSIYLDYSGGYFELGRDFDDEKSLIEKLVHFFETERDVALKYANAWTQNLSELNNRVGKTKQRLNNIENIKIVASIAKDRGIKEIAFDPENQELYLDDMVIRFRMSTIDESVIGLGVVEGIAAECGVNVVVVKND